MHYALIHVADRDLAAAWDDEAEAELATWLQAVDADGAGLHGSRLRRDDDATTVRIRAGELLLTDGPFAETKEQVAGYDVLECASLDEALRWAARHPTASRVGAIEVRALLEDEAGRLPEPAAGTTRYLALVCTDPAVDPAEFEREEPVEPWVAEMGSRGIRLYGSELDRPAAARTVRVRGGEAFITDGPFAETKEQIAGFDVLECADLDEAIAVVARHPMARLGLMEVRPFWPFGTD